MQFSLFFFAADTDSGVDGYNLARLIDFGVSTEEVLRSLEPPAELAELSRQ